MSLTPSDSLTLTHNFLRFTSFCLSVNSDPLCEAGNLLPFPLLPSLPELGTLAEFVSFVFKYYFLRLGIMSSDRFFLFMPSSPSHLLENSRLMEVAARIEPGRSSLSLFSFELRSLESNLLIIWFFERDAAPPSPFCRAIAFFSPFLLLFSLVFPPEDD